MTAHEAPGLSPCPHPDTGGRSARRRAGGPHGDGQAVRTWAVWERRWRAEGTSGTEGRTVERGTSGTGETWAFRDVRTPEGRPDGVTTSLTCSNKTDGSWGAGACRPPPLAG